MTERKGWRRYVPFFAPDVRADADDEIAFHIDSHTRDLIARGLTPHAARTEAERKFGDVGNIRDAVWAIDSRKIRNARRAGILADIRHDIHLAFRAIRTSPAHALAAIVTIALGIGATATILSAVNGILIQPLPYRDADDIVAIYARLKARNEAGINISYPDYLSWREQNRSFTDVGIWTWTSKTITGAGEPERLEAADVAPSVFQILGVAPALGRSFAPDENVDGKDRVVILSDGYWKRRFGGDSGIVGRTLSVNSTPHIVIGVMPPRFNFPERAELWVPFTPYENESRGSRGYAGAVARLKPGVTVEQAQADMDVISARLAAEFPKDNGEWDANILPIRSDLIGDLRRPVLIFLGAVAFLLAIACANVANLTLARGAARERDLAVRTALGAARWRLVRQMVTESLTLAAIGGVLGLGVAHFGVGVLRLAFPDGVPFYISLDVDAAVVAMVAGLTALTGLAFGLIPALHASSADPHIALQSGSRGAGTDRKRGRTRDVLVVAEVALSLVLLIGATLLIRSYRAYTTTDLGFDQRGVLSARITVPLTRYNDEQLRQFYSVLYDRMSAIPGVEVAGSARGIPFSGWDTQAGMTIEGHPPRGKDDRFDVLFQNVSPDYFRVTKTPLLAGRAFTTNDRDSTLSIAIINEKFAQMEFPGVDPLGKRFKFGGLDSKEPWITIVGVVGTYRHIRLPAPMLPAAYFPQLVSPSGTQTIVLRTSTPDPYAVLPSLRTAVSSLDSDIPLYRVQTFDEAVSRSLWRQRMQGQVLGLFAALALILATVGLYGVIAYGVTQRTREIGVRIALGATRGEIVRAVVWRGAQLTLIGLAIGTGAALALANVLGGLLYGVNATDPLTFGVIPPVLAAVAVLASYLPARRAAGIDPLVAMRAE